MKKDLTSVSPVDMVFDPGIWDAPLIGVRVKTLNNSLGNVSIASNTRGLTANVYIVVFATCEFPSPPKT